MFTGFASENTPAIQVWDSFRTYTGTATISLADDCAPIQIIRTGGNTTAIQLYLPSAPIEGKQIKIINARYGTSVASVQIRSADRSTFGTSGILISIGAGQTIDLCYSNSFISTVSGATVGSGWIFLNQNPVSAISSNSINFGASNSASGSNSAVIGGASSTASDTYSSVFCSNSSTNSGSQASIIGGNNHTLSAISSAILGGTSSNIAGSHSVALGGDTLQVTSGSYSGLLAGSFNTISASNAAIVGGSSNTSSGSGSAVVGGSSNTASGSSSAVVGGSSNTADSTNSIVIGGAGGTTRSIIGNFVTPASNGPIASSGGRHQLATLLLARQTTDATATVLASNSSAASTTNQVILPNNSAYTFQGTCIANVTGGGNTSGWKFEGVIKRGANAASTALVAAVTPTVIAQNAGASTWVLAITADTTNGGIAVTVTGQAATTIRWVVQIETTEVTF